MTFCSIFNFLQSKFTIKIPGNWIYEKRDFLKEFDQNPPSDLTDFMEQLSILSRTLYATVKNKIQEHFPNTYSLEKELATFCSFFIDAATDFITPYSHEFPFSFFELDDCPLGFYYQGPRTHLFKTKVAMVGSRKAAPYALKTATEIAQELAQHGFVVVSGGALGCDIAAHIGVCKASTSPLPALTVFAGGLQHLYPKENMDIFQILREKGGGFISERPHFYICKAFDFPKRNRLIIALAKEVLILQSGLKSGAMNSAHHALSLGRTLYVLRQKDDIRFDGNEQLIKDGVPFFTNTYEYLSGYRDENHRINTSFVKD